jgi:hypothetical protein
MTTISSYGTSPAVVISRERMKEGKYHKIISQTISNVNPPSVTTGNGVSVAITRWVQSWPTFNFDRISIPRFDGVSQYTGVPSNRPDFIKDYHFIGVMRCIDRYLSPTYSAFIFTEASSPWASPPAT